MSPEYAAVSIVQNCFWPACDKLDVEGSEIQFQLHLYIMHGVECWRSAAVYVYLLAGCATFDVL